ncbi:MAG: type VI secretion system baseplate subunit TssK [Minicystis sp.]
MIADDLARVRWRTGEVLQPAHFRLLERSLAAEAALRITVLGLPSYGVAQLKWSAPELESGQLIISDFLVVFQSGRVVASANAGQYRALDLGEAKSAKVDVSLYVKDLDAEEPAEAKIALRSAEEIPRVRLALRLSTDDTLQGYPDHLRLARFEKTIGGKWRLSDDFVPPLLQIGTNPFFKARLADLRESLTGFDNSLRAQLRDPTLRGEKFDYVKRARIAGLRLQGLVDDLRAEIAPHPYTLFAALRTLWLDLCLFTGSSPDEAIPQYEHEKLAQVLPPLFDRIAVFLKPAVGAGERAMVTFRKTVDGHFLASDIGDETLHASTIYLLIQNPRAQRSAPLDRVRLASASRLPHVHGRRLLGVPFERIDAPDLARRFGAYVDFYRLTITDEWRHVLEERSLAFQALPELAGVEAALYWSNE